MPQPERAPWPFSLSVAPAPMLTETGLKNMTKYLKKQGLNGRSTEELNEYIASAESQQAMREMTPETEEEQAENIVMEAWYSDPPKRYELARQALEIDSQCSDAYLILAETVSSWRKQRRYFERALAASESKVAPFKEEMQNEDAQDENGPPSLYERIETRPWFRARVSVARNLLEGGWAEEAQAIFQDLLKWDPNDHLGVRYDLIPLFHDLGDYETLSRILDQFADDTTAFLAYERLWLALFRQQEDAIEYLNQAVEANPFMFDMMTGTMGDVHWTPYVRLSSPEEAVAYFSAASKWWLDNPELITWVVMHWPKK
ncbi:MAG: hypothetical protein C7B43_09565 [Sulfobacillus benefaciens]|uniref:ST7 protein n=1 Tax=Sulfobacillus benefaciens TaxID=453960 RepID=A0A2T2X2B9_9FIRM|nr:MAG: hypothetical protein C7B43_09565 [Sulfobacillus benefaciens]